MVTVKCNVLTMESTTTVDLFPSCAPKSDQSPFKEQRSTCCVQVPPEMKEIFILCNRGSDCAGSQELIAI